jgi:uncharacterized membrane protein YtjA (UPF0391 family)
MTLCPKCAYQRLPSDSHIHEGVCPSCGIAYQKYLDRQRAGSATPDPSLVVEMEIVEPLGHRIRDRLLELPPGLDALNVGFRAATWCALALWAVYFTLHGIDWEVIGASFLHNIILPFHEFGHVLFMPFGRFMSILGGSLFQVLMPLGLMLVFIIKQRDTFAASVMLWWSGQSLVDLSPYIADASLRALPLVGGGGEESHDWGNLLTMTGLLNAHQGIARLCFCLGVAVMLAGLVWGAKLLRMQHARYKSAEPYAGADRAAPRKRTPGRLND